MTEGISLLLPVTLILCPNLKKKKLFSIFFPTQVFCFIIFIAFFIFLNFSLFPLFLILNLSLLGSTPRELFYDFLDDISSHLRTRRKKIEDFLEDHRENVSCSANFEDFSAILERLRRGEEGEKAEEVFGGITEPEMREIFAVVCTLFKSPFYFHFLTTPHLIFLPHRFSKKQPEKKDMNRKDTKRISTTTKTFSNPRVSEFNPLTHGNLCVQNWSHINLTRHWQERG